MSTKTTHRQRRKKGPASSKMTTPPRKTTTPQKMAVPPRRRSVWRWRNLRTGIVAAAVVGVAIIALGILFFLNNPNNGNATNNGQYAFQVGSPGPGATAPEINLPATNGSSFDLAALRGKTVLLYFQEGLTCQPCWDQLKDIQSNIDQFHKLGIDEIVSITSDPLSSLQQKVSDEGLTIPVLSDTQLAVSNAYTANSYGMMGNSRDGHTFIVVGPDGTIKWRADYGGAPNYTMYVPVSHLVADICTGLNGKSS